MSISGNYEYDKRIGLPIGETERGQPVVVKDGDGSLTSGEALKDDSRPEHRYDDHELSDTTKQGWECRPSETTFSADKKDAYGNSLPQTGEDGRNLGAQRKRMWEWQHGYRGGGSKASLKDKLSTVEALADALHVSDAITSDAKRLARKCDGRAFNRLGALEAVALGCIAVAENRTIERSQDYEDRIQVRYIKEHDDERIYAHDSPRFKHLAEKHGVDWVAAIRKVKEEISGR